MEFTSRRVIKTLNTKQGRPLIISPDGKTIAKGNYNGNVELWGLKTGKKKLIFATLPNNEWIVYQPSKNIYVSSPKGDEYAVVQFGKSLLPLLPLKKLSKKNLNETIYGKHIENRNHGVTKLIKPFQQGFDRIPDVDRV